jgi:cell division protein FtsB
VRGAAVEYHAVGMSSEPRSTLPFRRLALVVGVIAALFILGDLNRRMEDARKMERDGEALASQVSALESQSIALQTQVAGVNSDAAIESWAHSEGKLIRDGEKLIVPIPPPGAPTPRAPTPTPYPDPPSPWLVWSELLFGD